MTTTKDEPIPTPPPPSIHKSAEYSSMYINWVQPSFTPFDISLLVGQAGNREKVVLTDQGAVEIEIKARLAFHPAEAKIIAHLLLQTIENYEKQIGDLEDENERLINDISKLEKSMEKLKLETADFKQRVIIVKF